MMLNDLSDVELVACFQDLVIEEQEKLALHLNCLAELDLSLLEIAQGCAHREKLSDGEL